MGTQEAQETALTQQPSYTVDALLDRMGVKANMALWASIDTIIRVQGVVGKVKAYKNACYFDLRGAESKLSIKCELALSPQEGDHVIIEGMPSFSPSKFTTGLEVVVKGVPVHQLEIKDAEVDLALPNLEKPRYLRLYDYLRDHDIKHLHLMGTETAIRDVISHLDAAVAALITTQKVRVSDKNDIYKKLGAVPSGTKAIAIVRGGDDATLEVWNDRAVIEALIGLDMPFYLALGHTHGITLASRYADETFHTPSALGSSLRSVIAQITQEREIARRNDMFIKKENMFTEQAKQFEQTKKSFSEQAKQFEESKKLFLSNEKTLKEKESLLTKSLDEKERTYQQQLGDKDKALQQTFNDVQAQTTEEISKKLRPYKIGIVVLVLAMAAFVFFGR